MSEPAVPLVLSRITSEESDVELGANLRENEVDEYTSSDDDETADQKRKRLAQEHLEKLKAYVGASALKDAEAPLIGEKTLDSQSDTLTPQLRQKEIDSSNAYLMVQV